MFKERHQTGHTLLTQSQRRRRLTRGEALYHAAEPARAVYVVTEGSFKSRMTLEDGRDHVIGFYMEGEVLGLDAVGLGNHRMDVEALQDSEVCVVPLSRLKDAATQHDLYALIARELARGHAALAMLGALSAAERLAAFLLDLSHRRRELGLAHDDFLLPMSRHEIGNHLGLTLETVSRMFSRFQDADLIEVSHKHVRILDAAGLAAATHQGAE